MLIYKVSILVYYDDMWNKGLPVYWKIKSVFCILDGYFWGITVLWNRVFWYDRPPVQGPIYGTDIIQLIWDFFDNIIAVMLGIGSQTVQGKLYSTPNEWM